MLVSNAEELLQDYFAGLWSQQSSYTPSLWTVDNPAIGQDVPTALAIQKYLGGNILKCKIHFRDGSPIESHYWNIIGEDEIDATFAQYAGRKLGNEVFHGIVSKETLLSDPDTRKRYENFADALNAANAAEFFFSLTLPNLKTGH